MPDFLKFFPSNNIKPQTTLPLFYKIMPTKCFEDMQSRGYFYQFTDEESVIKLLNETSTSFYVGFDPTADSLHIGHLLPVMAARRLQQFGHRPIMLVGGATALVGDPSGRQEARPLLTVDTVRHNSEAIKEQLSRFIDFNTADFVNNADWFTKIYYLDFLRDIGPHFSVNKMLSMDSVKMRMETGISFLEFNYMILQAYDFMYLNEKYGCELQVGGQDQWGNIVTGVDLARRVKGKQLYGATWPLLMDSSGKKFGKSLGNAVWLDKNRTPVFDYYQYWRNVEDADVCKLLCFFTSLPTEEIEELKNLQAPRINRAKEILAFEATLLAHGFEEAKNAYIAAGTKFGFADPENKIFTTSSIKDVKNANSTENLPTFEIPKEKVEEGAWIVEALALSGLCSSNSEARRLIQGGGAYVNNEKVSDINLRLTINDFKNGELIIKAGKKNIKRFVIK